jgi:hypothetical protein
VHSTTFGRLDCAEAQAESELFGALGIASDLGASGAPGVQLDELGEDDDGDAYLFAVSALLLEVAVEQAAGTASPDAQLQGLMATIASDLAATGTLPGDLQADILAAQQALDVDLTMDQFGQWLSSIDAGVSPANLNRAIDSDGDGVDNATDTCPLVANPVQSTIPPDVLCSVTRHTTPSPYLGTLVGDFFGNHHPGLFGCFAILQTDQQDQCAILPGDGAGGFRSPIPVATPPWPFGVTMVADINDDGAIDLVGQQGYLPGDGTGHFVSVRSTTFCQ